MTEQEIQHQIDIINAAAKKALRSKKASHQFLVDAGILPPDKRRNMKVKQKK